LTFQRVNGHLICRLDNGELVNNHKPSVEVMFDSLRNTHTGTILAVMLTGMGADGADAMLRISNESHPCIVQDEESSVVWGMPKAAYDLGVCASPTSLLKIPEQILSILKTNN
jgi:two-component system chemotaxis response regulator CheB